MSLLESHPYQLSCIALKITETQFLLDWTNLPVVFRNMFAVKENSVPLFFHDPVPFTDISYSVHSHRFVVVWETKFDMVNKTRTSLTSTLPFLLLTLTQTFPSRPWYSCEPFQPQGKVWVRVSTRKGTVQNLWSAILNVRVCIQFTYDHSIATKLISLTRI